MPSILSLSITTSAVGACIMTHSAEYRTHRVVRTGFDAASLCRDIAACFEALKLDEKPQALAVVSEPDAVFVNKRGEAVTPIYTAPPLVMPRHDVPPIFAEDPILAHVFRNSVLRRLQATMPELGQTEKLGISTSCALIIRTLTGAHVDCTWPLGIDDAFAKTDPMAWRALGVDMDLSVNKVLPNAAIAPINEMDDLPEFAAPLADLRKSLRGVPVIHCGNALASQAYASAANPLSWAVSLGWAAKAMWNASRTALSAYQIQIMDDGRLSAAGAQTADAQQNDASREKTRDEWTQYLSDNLHLDIAPGARRSDSGYILQTAPFDADFVRKAHEAVLSDFNASDASEVYACDVLSRAPLGSAGLHVWSGNLGIQAAGLTSAHSNAHIVRAVFESFAYQLKAWRAQTMLDGLGPLRVSFAHPWDISAAQTFADALGCPILVIDTPPESLSAIGAALALMRDQALCEPGASPKLSGYPVEPCEAAALYAQHYDIHTLLRQ